jgi:hypothetical protein
MLCFRGFLTVNIIAGFAGFGKGGDRTLRFGLPNLPNAIALRASPTYGTRTATVVINLPVIIRYTRVTLSGSTGWTVSEVRNRYAGLRIGGGDIY